MVLLKMLMKIGLPKMRGLLVMMMSLISPSGSILGGIAPPERKIAPTQVPPREGGASSRKSSPYFFFQGIIYKKMGIECWPVPPLLTRACQGGRHALMPSGHLGGPLWYFFSPIFIIYSKIILCKISAHLEMCRIGISDIAFSGPEFQLPVISLFV